MASNSTSSKRKRLPCEIDDDDDESLPISKRINGLHIQTDRNSTNQDQISPIINGHPVTWQLQGSQLPGCPSQLSPLSVSAAQESLRNSSDDSRQSTSSNCSVLHPDLQGYEPELNMSENPHYFQINEVLYRAHVERATRINQYFINNT